MDEVSLQQPTRSANKSSLKADWISDASSPAISMAVSGGALALLAWLYLRATPGSSPGVRSRFLSDGLDGARTCIVWPA